MVAEVKRRAACERRAKELGARPGAFVGPVTRDGWSHIYVLDRKDMPAEHDPELRGRAERILLERVTDHAVRDHITSLGGFPR